MLGGISIWQLLIVLAIVVLIFGTRKLRNVGGDLGGFIRNFKSSMKDGEGDAPAAPKLSEADDSQTAPADESGRRQERSDAPKSGG